MMKIRYIGKKPQRADTLYGSGLVWSGHGDVQTCTDAAKAKLLLRHNDIFEDADAVQAPAPAPAPVAMALYGSDAFGSAVQISESSVIALGDVVRAAHFESGLSVAEWNNLIQSTRDTYIASTIDRARQVAAQRKAQQQAQQQPAVASQAPSTDAVATSAQVTAAATGGDQPDGTGEQGEDQGDESGDAAGDHPVYRMKTEAGPLDLTPLDKETLRKLCREQNLVVSNNAGENTLRRKLAEAFPVDQA